MKNTESQMVDDASMENSTPEPTIDMDTVTDESFDPTVKLAEQVASWQDKYTRLSAEFDNYRKRTVKEKMELIENGGGDMLRAVLPTLDDFERALAHMADGNDKEGVSLIYQTLLHNLKAKGVHQMELRGLPFNVDLAEAVAKFPVEELEKKGTVIDVAQNGYMLKDKVLRFAKVIVGE
ncbi:MAG: nucleotide exchange factor GrpE [Mucinivorans sp.]